MPRSRELTPDHNSELQAEAGILFVSGAVRPCPPSVGGVPAPHEVIWKVVHVLSFFLPILKEASLAVSIPLIFFFKVFRYIETQIILCNGS